MNVLRVVTVRLTSTSLFVRVIRSIIFLLVTPDVPM